MSDGSIYTGICQILMSMLDTVCMLVCVAEQYMWQFMPDVSAYSTYQPIFHMPHQCQSIYHFISGAVLLWMLVFEIPVYAGFSCGIN